MDGNAIRFFQKSSPRVSIDSQLLRSVKKLSSLTEIVFQRGERYRNECNQASYLTKDPNNILSSQNHLSTKKNVKHLDPKHTHTLNKSNQFIFQKQVKHTLTHVFLVMAKSHLTCTYIKSSKEFACVKNITRLHKCLHVMMI